MKQILSPDGKIRYDDPWATEMLDKHLDGETILRLYKVMVRARVFEELMTADAHGSDRMPLYISPKGHEAIEVACDAILAPKDQTFKYARFHVVDFARGVSEKAFMDFLYGIPDVASFPFLQDIASKERRSGIAEWFEHGSMYPYILVGVHLTHAVGYALGMRFLEKPVVAVAYFGDGASARGHFHSALNWASIFKAPVIFVCENNGVAVSTPLAKQTATGAIHTYATSYSMESFHIDGCDLLASIAVMKEAYAYAQAKGPVLIEANVVRLDSHTTAIGVNTPEWDEYLKGCVHLDPLIRTKSFLLSEEARHFDICWSESEDKEWHDDARKDLEMMREEARAQCDATEEHAEEVVRKMLDEQNRPLVIAEKTHGPLLEDPYLLAPTVLRGKKKSVTDGEREEYEGLTMVDALAVAQYDVFRHIRGAYQMGEDIGGIGSVFRSVALSVDMLHELGLKEFIPRAELLRKSLPLQALGGRFSLQFEDSPLDEEGLAGIAVGLSLVEGLRPVIEVQFSGFVHAMKEQLVSQSARMFSRTWGQKSAPLVVRLPYGGARLIEHHREEEVHQFLGVPGVVIAVPATVQDCYDLFWASCLSARPVLFFEPKMLYRRKDIATPLQRGIPEQPIEHFGARIVCEGTDITLVTFGAMVHVAESAAQEVHTIDGVSVEVIDLRVIKPYDFETIEKSISKTGRLIVAHEGGFAGSVAQMIISDVSMRLLDTLVAPPVAVTAPAIDFPPHAAYKAYLVDKEDMVAGMRDVLDVEKQY